MYKVTILKTEFSRNVFPDGILGKRGEKRAHGYVDILLKEWIMRPES